MTTQTMLKVTGLKVAYGGIQAVKGVSFEVLQGELVSLIGANGAGKTTTLKAITGIQPVAAGEIEFMGRPIKGQGAWDLVKKVMRAKAPPVLAPGVMLQLGLIGLVYTVSRSEDRRSGLT